MTDKKYYAGKLFHNKNKAIYLQIKKELFIMSLLDIESRKINIHGKPGIEMPLFGLEDLHDLTSYIPMTCISNERRIEILYNILLEVANLNNKGIIHVDVKLENFIVQHKFPLKLKLIDFGLSEIVQNNKFNQIRAIRGTKEYMSPEILQNRIYYNSDLYSIGVIAILLWTDSALYNEQPIFMNYKDCVDSMKLSVPVDVYEFIKATVTGQESRSTIAQLQSMSLFKNIRQNLLEQPI